MGNSWDYLLECGWYSGRDTGHIWNIRWDMFLKTVSPEKYLGIHPMVFADIGASDPQALASMPQSQC